MSLILVVDDHYPMRVALEELLKQMGHQVVGAANGKEALALQQQYPATVLLTDIFMPEMDGFEVMQKFRDQFPTVNVIAMTGGMSRSPGGPYLEIAKKFGAKWILPKPFTALEFVETIRAATGERPAA
jgi:CheY-like chemotaxis protein